MIGAIAIKSMTDEINMTIKKSIPEYWNNEHKEITPGEAQELFDNAVSQYPLLGEYLNYADFKGYDTTEIADAITDKLNSYMNWYILRRIGWSLLFIIASAVLVIKTKSTADITNSRMNKFSSRVKRKDDF
jgi:hypothetical protein